MTIFETFCVNNNCFFMIERLKCRHIDLYTKRTKHKEGDYYAGRKFTLMQYNISAILGLIEAGSFVIPEIQRPFVWKNPKLGI